MTHLHTIPSTCTSILFSSSGVFELQGGVSVFQLNVVSAATNYEQQHDYDSDASSPVILGDLTPVTSFTLTLTLLMHGGESISSAPIEVTTLEGGKTHLIVVIRIFLWNINWLRLSDAIWQHRSGSTLAQVMPDGTKPLPEPMLSYHQ